MNQFIVNEQFKLPKKLRMKLKLWGIEHKYYDIWDKMSIGQMIEFLFYEKKEDTEIFYNLNGWDVRVKSIYYHESELCDALWEAVKDVLES